MGTAVLNRTEKPHRNGSEFPREEVMRRARRDVRGLADQGLSPGEIQERIQETPGFPSMNETERDLVWLVATHEVDRTRREPAYA